MHCKDFKLEFLVTPFTFNVAKTRINDFLTMIKKLEYLEISFFLL